jgi:hypothetical protein
MEAELYWRPMPTVRAAVLVAVGLVVLSAGSRALESTSQPVAGAVPAFDVDPRWPTMPRQWILGQVSGVAVDAQDHVWVLQRRWSLNNDEKSQNPEAECCTAAPPVMEFDSGGNYLRGWGGRARPHFRSPDSERGGHLRPNRPVRRRVHFHAQPCVRFAREFVRERGRHRPPRSEVDDQVVCREAS